MSKYDNNFKVSDELSFDKEPVPFKPITNKNGRANLTYKDGELIYEAGTIPDEERVKLTKQLVDEMDDGEMTNGISDGSHTFGDLYYQRMVLTSVIAKAIVTSDKPHGKVFRSKLHADGTMFKDYFIVVFQTIDGYFSYHYHIDNWDNFFFVKEIPKAPEYDGHTDTDVSRLLTIFPLAIPNTLKNYPYDYVWRLEPDTPLIKEHGLISVVTLGMPRVFLEGDDINKNLNITLIVSDDESYHVQLDRIDRDPDTNMIELEPGTFAYVVHMKIAL